MERLCPLFSCDLCFCVVMFDCHRPHHCFGQQLTGGVAAHDRRCNCAVGISSSPQSVVGDYGLTRPGDPAG